MRLLCSCAAKYFLRIKQTGNDVRSKTVQTRHRSTKELERNTVRVRSWVTEPIEYSNTVTVFNKTDALNRSNVVYWSNCVVWYSTCPTSYCIQNMAKSFSKKGSWHCNNISQQSCAPKPYRNIVTCQEPAHNTTIIFSYFKFQKLRGFPLLALRLISISLQHSNDRASSLGFKITCVASDKFVVCSWRVHCVLQYGWLAVQFLSMSPLLICSAITTSYIWEVASLPRLELARSPAAEMRLMD